MTELKARIVARIEAFGPMPVNEYFASCLFDPEHGYYTTRDPFGRGGDFTTAPEVSQIFGELIGAWIVAAWHTLRRPARPVIAEIGPGRGTLMKDIVRTLGRIEPALRNVARLNLVEISPRLRGVQAATLQGMGEGFSWYAEIDELPDGPLFIVGNELFDAIPLRQYVKAQGLWRERCVGVDPDGNLMFVAGAGSLDPALLPGEASAAPEGAIVELAPARGALMQKIAERIARHGGAGLFIDYGYARPAPGDTLQAVRSHAYADVLADPGEADLTAHVDFAALAAVAQACELEARLLTQGKFLLAMGLLERAGALGANADKARREQIAGEVERLAGPDAMGTLFKVLILGPPGMPLPPAAAAS